MFATRITCLTDKVGVITSSLAVGAQAMLDLVTRAEPLPGIKTVAAFAG